MAKILLFDTQRSALHDGPGIRTVFFLKGCHLHCEWCCNPESQTELSQLQFIDNLCNGCFKCVDTCKSQVIAKGKQKPVIDFKKCIKCGKCAERCPNSALKMVGKPTSIEEIIEIAKKDIPFYKDKGGVTISGGESLYHGEFVIELLKRLKEEGINTCVETCGYVPTETMVAAMPYIDLFLFDYKITDPKKHTRWTGNSNELILANLDAIMSGGAKAILRCPIIPTVNDNKGHFKGIMQLGDKYSGIEHIEILSYHDFGVHKYAQLGMDYKLKKIKRVPREKAQQWLEEIKTYGTKRVIIG